ncbi:Thiamine-monophosphate kinase [Candidatus Lokiarchaeum ossiferum]|uniref:Thiamine-monophosphate kinase n=1 Tax=Candidatus Lokiarchaeum ossiferum TaxID=2951803 RepID=A0ABY6HWZ7_9ARCH|nr:Thiamine-monophosphate kinase [Candidatus Lokiarchaeum sp. B-35]
MADLEGIAKKLLQKGIADEKIIHNLIDQYKIYKSFPDNVLRKMAAAILKESKISLSATSQSELNQKIVINKLLGIPQADITMGQGGVGCRGQGDFYVHDLLAKLSQTSVKPHISPLSLDDTGAIDLNFNSSAISKSKIILTKMEGMHSRLSDYPFLAGFHVTRAALRDIYVKGGNPLSIMVDVHLADDGDIGKLFDFQAGIACVAEVAKVPITAGSTLRIGGDMVIGDRLTGGIAAIGQMEYSFFRKNIQNGDIILMTEGAGGGTITTSALYSGQPEVILKTLNLKFLKACKLLFQNPSICSGIHSMADVTNGGLRGDLYEINNESQLGARIRPEFVKSLVDPKILEMLESNNIDFLGVSLDALLIFSSAEVAPKIIDLLQSNGIKTSIVGEVTPNPEIIFVSPDGEEKIIPRFRESAYTPIKQVVDKDSMNSAKNEIRILQAYQKAQEKRKYFETMLKHNSN